MEEGAIFLFMYICNLKKQSGSGDTVLEMYGCMGRSSSEETRLKSKSVFKIIPINSSTPYDGDIKTVSVDPRHAWRQDTYPSDLGGYWARGMISKGRTSAPCSNMVQLVGGWWLGG